MNENVTGKLDSTMHTWTILWKQEGGMDNRCSVSVVSECLTLCTLHKLFLLHLNMVGMLFPCIESRWGRAVNQYRL